MRIRWACLLVGSMSILACNEKPPEPKTEVANVPLDTSFLEQYAATNKLTLGRPTAFRVTRDGSAVFFLRSQARTFERDLYVYDVAAKKERVLATASQLLNGGIESLSPEERAKRERMRLTAKGIAHYDISNDGKRALVPISGKLYVVDRDSGSATELTDTGGYPNDPTFSPKGDKVACVRNGDLYVIDIAANSQARLTMTGGGAISNGLPEFVAQEEMDRFRGYWWSPDGSMIAYQETDTRGMDRSYIADPTKVDVAPQSWPYPRPGRPNAIVRLGIVDVRGGATRWIVWDSVAYPYLATVAWDDDAPLVMLVQNRAQTDVKLYEVEVGRGATRELLKEHDDAWINLEQSVPRFFEHGRRFVWISESGGAPVLQLHEASGVHQSDLTKAELGLHELAYIDNVQAFVLASADATDSRLFRVPLDGAAPSPVAPERSKDTVAFTAGAPIFVHSSTLEDGTVRDIVRSIDGTEVGAITSVAETPGLTPKIELTRVTDDQLNAVLIRPRDFVAGKKYPVVVHVYSGPGVRIVDRMTRSYLLDQWIADSGQFVVVSIDGRGTPGRGRAFERVIKNDLIGVQLGDQVRGLQALAAKYPELDLTRAGIYGWSFGGYAAAHAVMQQPEVFKAGVAGAPVTDWRDYDTHYTERYLGIPETNEETYVKSSVFTYTSQLARPLMIVHGTADDNVYFAHSLKLADTLFRAGKSYQFIPLINFTHMVPDPVVNTQLYAQIVGFFRDKL